MKITLLFALALLGSPTSAFAQATWTPQATQPLAIEPVPIDPRVQFFGIAKGWALDSKGHLSKTVDGGAIWSRPARAAVYYNSMYFINPDTGWVMDETSRVYRTRNGGKNWDTLSRVSSNQARIFFSSADTGWALGRSVSVHQSIDAGALWTPRDAGVSDPRALFYKDSAGWVLMGSELQKSAGGRNSWTRSLLRGRLNALFFISAKTGWLVGDTGAIVKTTDGGSTWRDQVSGTKRHLRALHFLDADTGWAVGDSGVSLTTVNGGQTWSPSFGGTTDTLLRVWFVNARTGWALGKTGAIYRTSTAQVPTDIRATSPTNPRFTLTGRRLLYRLNRRARVTVTVHALNGYRETVLFEGPQSAGLHALEIPATLAPGIRFLSFDDGETRRVKALILP